MNVPASSRKHLAVCGLGVSRERADWGSRVGPSSRGVAEVQLVAVHVPLDLEHADAVVELRRDRVVLICGDWRTAVVSLGTVSSGDSRAYDCLVTRRTSCGCPGSRRSSTCGRRTRRGHCRRSGRRRRRPVCGRRVSKRQSRSLVIEMSKHGDVGGRSGVNQPRRRIQGAVEAIWHPTPARWSVGRGGF